MPKKLLDCFLHFFQNVDRFLRKINEFSQKSEICSKTTCSKRNTNSAIIVQFHLFSRERERDRERDRERQRERDIERETERETERDFYDEAAQKILILPLVKQTKTNNVSLFLLRGDVKKNPMLAFRYSTVIPKFTNVSFFLLRGDAKIHQC